MTKQEGLELYRNMGLFGVQDLRRLSPIGDIGYLNSISYYEDVESFEGFLRSGLVRIIYDAFCEQYKPRGFTSRGWSTGWANTDHHTHCPELGLTYHVDSSG